MPDRRFVLSLLLALVLALGASCGGGSGDPDDEGDDEPIVPPPPELQTVDLVSDASRDGWVQSIGGTSTHTLPRAGDGFGTNPTYAAFFAFPLDQAPAINLIEKATLLIDQVQVIGTPYTDLGTLDAYQVDIGVGLDQTDLTAPVLATAGTLATTPALAVHTLDVTNLLKSNLTAGRARLDLRLEFTSATDSDGLADYVELNDGADTSGTASPAKITVEYR